MVMRIRYQRLGGHVHCRVFTAPSPQDTFSKCGNLTFNEHEWPEVLASLDRIAEVMQEEWDNERGITEVGYGHGV